MSVMHTSSPDSTVQQPTADLQGQPEQSTGLSTDKPSRQFLTAQKLKSRGTKLWACDRCYRLKNKCNSARPSCNVCAKGNHECTYGHRGSKQKHQSPATDGGSTTVGSTRESCFEEVDDESVTPPSMKKSRRTYTDMLQTRLYEVEEAARSLCAPDGSRAQMEMEEKMRRMNVAQGASTPATFQYDLAGTGVERQQQQSPIVMNNVYSALPTDQTLFSPPVILYLIQTFFRDIVPIWYPNPIHQTSFMSRYPDHSPLLIYVMCAAAARRSDHPVTRAYVAGRGIPLYQAGEPYFWMAREEINKLVGQPSYEIVLALVTLGLAVAGMGLVDASVQVMTLAIQSALNLHLDVDPDVEEVHGQLTWLEKESRRRLWWTLCMYDRQPKPGLETIARQDNPPMIDDQSLSSVDQFCFNGVCTSPSTNPPAPEAVWLSVEEPDGIPNCESFAPNTDIDFGNLSGRLAKVYYQIQALHQSLHGSPDPSAISIAMQMSSPNSPTIPIPTSPAIPTSRAALESEALLAVELQAIMGSLPEWGRSVDGYSEFSPSSTSRFPPPWQLLTQHIVIHALMVCLYLPTVLGAADQLRNLHQSSLDPSLAPPAHLVTSYHRCRYHATLIASYLRKIMAVNPSGRWIDWYTLYMAFRSALVFVVVLKTEIESEELVHARRDLEIHLEVMRSVGRHMWFGSWMTKMVESIILEA
ncbi:hypothetical protein PhCBS80983_g03383 [Powellomyces hirtus]|uniref:Zn(2)-C6 fungal-type domain-containing protein n=1 Tax=Powellomyces hirtus TaxID=109895 RepID=A0A507E1W2_9FUNG|nr:hypothetical protein PhCBS80983_g03383 [Powellomyces hirtus]